MSPAEVSSIESATGVALPEAYRCALQEHGLVGEWTDHPEFITDASVLVTENKHFKMNPEDLSEVRASGLIGAIKFFLLYGTGKRLLESRRKWHKTWVKGNRFVIGNDLGEEQYFIVLREPTTKVYCYELETKRAHKVAESLHEWIAEVKRMQLEAESETY